MILKSMGVECKKDDMDGYAGEVDEEATGKFTFLQFCQVGIDYHPGGQERLTKRPVASSTCSISASDQ